MLNGQDDYIIVNIIEGFLGSPRFSKDSETRVQWEFNCPSTTCRHDADKFNLAYKSNDKVFKCWKCKYSGYVHRLVGEYGSKDDIKRLDLILPKYNNHTFNVFRRPKLDYDLITCDLPDGYLPLSELRKSRLYDLAWDYAVNQRKISPAQIDKFKIGYTESGTRKFRIILPSLNSHGKINYYEARAYLKDAKRAYMKPDSPDKQDIIYNEYYINWDLPIYLVEGVFDALRIPNAIPMLGKNPSELLINKLLKNNSTVIVCLDSDAFKDGMGIYKQLSSLGLNVFFIDLKGQKDISKIYEDNGQEKLNEVLRTVRKIDETFEINKILNE